MKGEDKLQEVLGHYYQEDQYQQKLKELNAKIKEGEEMRRFGLGDGRNILKARDPRQYEVIEKIKDRIDDYERNKHTIDLKLMQIPEVSRFKGGNKDDQPVVINSGLGKRKEMKKKRKYIKVDPELFKDVSADIPYPKIQPYFKIDPKMKTK